MPESQDLLDASLEAILDVAGDPANHEGGEEGQLSEDAWAAIQAILDDAEDPEALAKSLDQGPPGGCGAVSSSDFANLPQSGQHEGRRPLPGRYFPATRLIEAAPSPDVASDNPNAPAIDALLDAALSHGLDVLERLTRDSLQRRLGTDGLAPGKLFDQQQLAELAEALAAVLGTADLIGRTQLHDVIARRVPLAHPVGEAVEVPVTKQDTKYTCGAAALQAVLAAYGLPRREALLACWLGSDPKEGTRPSALVGLCRELGLPHEERHDATVEDLAHVTGQGVPLLCCVQMHGGGHWVAVRDVADGQVHFMDPVEGHRSLPAEEWDRIWQDTDADGKPYVRYGLAIGPPEKASVVHESVRLCEVKDDSGHEHDAKGQFTGTGGGGAAHGEEKPKKQTRREKRRAEHEAAVKAHQENIEAARARHKEKVDAWRARDESIRSRRAMLEATSNDVSDFVSVETGSELNDLDPLNPGTTEDELQNTPEGREKWLARCQNWLRVANQAAREQYIDGPLQRLGELGASERLKASVTKDGEREVIRNQKASEKFLDLARKKLDLLQKQQAIGHDEEGWISSDDPAEDARRQAAWEGTQAKFDQVQDKIDDVDEKLQTTQDFLTSTEDFEQSWSDVLDRMQDQLDKEDDKNGWEPDEYDESNEPEPPEEPDWDKQEEEVVSAHADMLGEFENIAISEDSPDPDKEEELYDRLESAIDDFGSARTDTDMDELRNVLTTAREVARDYAGLGNSDAAASARRIAATALRTLRVMDEELPPKFRDTRESVLWEAFEIDPTAIFEPASALDYFLGLVPTLGLDPQRWEADLRRRAFTLAVATETELLDRVQGAIADLLQSGEGISTAPATIQAILDDAGVTPANPGYAATVWRTNAMDALVQGYQDELSQQTELFPTWKYTNPDDSRSRPHHAEKDGNYYSSSVPFVKVRGEGPEDACNCRCVPIAVFVTDWEELHRQGARLTSFP